MTELLEQAIAKLKSLPTQEQDAIAAMILQELDDERRWDKQLEKDVADGKLEAFAKEAIADFEAGHYRTNITPAHPHQHQTHPQKHKKHH